jgi:hypothetical protein
LISAALVLDKNTTKENFTGAFEENSFAAKITMKEIGN